MDMDPANFVAVETPPIVGDVCDMLGNPVAITFRYVPGDTVDTAQDPGKADIVFDSGTVDPDGVSFVVVTDQSDAAKALSGDGKQFFRGDVAIDERLRPTKTRTPLDRIPSSTSSIARAVACCNPSSITPPARSRYSWAT